MDCRYFDTWISYPKLFSLLPLFPFRFYWTSEKVYVYSLCLNKTQNSLIIGHSYRKDFATFTSKSCISSTNISHRVFTSADATTVQFTQHCGKSNYASHFICHVQEQKHAVVAIQQNPVGTCIKYFENTSNETAASQVNLKMLFLTWMYNWVIASLPNDMLTWSYLE